MDNHQFKKETQPVADFLFNHDVILRIEELLQPLNTSVYKHLASKMQSSRLHIAITKCYWKDLSLFGINLSYYDGISHASINSLNSLVSTTIITGLDK